MLLIYLLVISEFFWLTTSKNTNFAGQSVPDQLFLFPDNPSPAIAQVPTEQRRAKRVFDCLVTTISSKLKIEHSNYEILQVPGITLLDKTTLNELLTNQDYDGVKKLDYIQLRINYI
jgi:hypothetical protein